MAVLGPASSWQTSCLLCQLQSALEGMELTAFERVLVSQHLHLLNQLVPKGQTVRASGFAIS